MADAMDDVRSQVKKVGDDLRNAYTFKPQREAASRAIDNAKKTVRDTYTKYRDKAKRAVSSGRSRSR